MKQKRKRKIPSEGISFLMVRISKLFFLLLFLWFKLMIFLSFTLDLIFLSFNFYWSYLDIIPFKIVSHLCEQFLKICFMEAAPHFIFEAHLFFLIKWNVSRPFSSYTLGYELPCHNFWGFSKSPIFSWSVLLWILAQAKLSTLLVERAAILQGTINTSLRPEAIFQRRLWDNVGNPPYRS